MRPIGTPRSTGPSGAYVWLVMMKAHRAVQQHAQRSLASLGIGLSDFVVLEMLLNKGPQKVNDIGRRVGLTSGSITTAVDRLESQGLVSRKVNQEDSRSRIVALTAKGRALIREGFADHAARMEKAVSGLDVRERRELVALLKKLGLDAQARLGAAEDAGD